MHKLRSLAAADIILGAAVTLYTGGYGGLVFAAIGAPIISASLPCTIQGEWGGWVADFGRHLGDIEYVKVELDSKFDVTSVTYFAHGDPHVYQAADLQFSGTHPIIAPAGWGHGSYPPSAWSFVKDDYTYVSMPKGDFQLVEFLDVHSNNQETAIKWEPWRQPEKIIPLGLDTDNNPINEQEWVKFSGVWGQEIVNHLSVSRSGVIGGDKNLCQKAFLAIIGGIVDDQVIDRVASMTEYRRSSGPSGLGRINKTVEKSSYVVNDPYYPPYVSTPTKTRPGYQV